MFSIYACGNNKTIQIPIDTGTKNVEFTTYGFLNKKENYNELIRYHIIIGNVVWSCILAETIVAPVYFLGFSLYEPISLKSDSFIKGETAE
jgi:hypothetical protein